jgi:hypothetical protein
LARGIVPPRCTNSKFSTAKVSLSQVVGMTMDEARAEALAANQANAIETELSRLC